MNEMTNTGRCCDGRITGGLKGLLYDVSSFAAHVAFGRPGERAVVNAAIDSLVAGYGARPADRSH